MPIRRDTGRGAPQHSATPSKRRDVVLTKQFKKDFKREEQGRYGAVLRADLQSVIDKLADDIPLPRHMVDHPLGENWKDHRDCHIRPDLILIYRKAAASKGKSQRGLATPRLSLVRFGSHSELGI